MTTVDNRTAKKSRFSFDMDSRTAKTGPKFSWNQDKWCAQSKRWLSMGSARA